MDIHEYQAKIILKKYGIPVTDFVVVSNMEEALAGIEKLKLEKAVIKIQVHAGGRGKAGGVKIAKNKQEILDYTKKLLGFHLVNNQTGKEGVVANQVLITPLTDFQKEYYLGAVIDRKNGLATLIISPEGGMDIEEVASKYPDKILKIPLSLEGKLKNYHYLQINKLMDWSGDIAQQGKLVVSNLAKAFIETDASLLEINPLVLTNDNKIVALDAKLSVDDNALYRQKEIASFFDPTQISVNEVKAKEFDLAYIALDGTIGCMVNGAGLAMATMDIIKHFGGTPANFLDVGGGASKEKVAEGFKIILSDDKVKAILVNIFGGIMNCATLASGIKEACLKQQVKVPIIVRMEGTNVEEGKKILKESGLNIRLTKDLNEAAKLAVSVSAGI